MTWRNGRESDFLRQIAAPHCNKSHETRRNASFAPYQRSHSMTDFYNLVPSAPEGRFDGIERPYSPADVKKLRGSVQVRQTLAEMGANRLWKLLHEDDYVNALGALSGNQAMQMVRAGLKAIYLSGWQVAADANTASSHVSRPVALSRQRRAGTVQAHQQDFAARRPDRNVGRRRACRSTHGSRRSSPTPRPGSAGRSTRLKS